jgi:hypothetical protein
MAVNLTPKGIRTSLLYSRFNDLIQKHGFSIDQLKAVDTLLNQMSAYNYEWYAKYADAVIEQLRKDTNETPVERILGSSRSR